jgi:hypothetical protein
LFWTQQEPFIDVLLLFAIGRGTVFAFCCRIQRLSFETATTRFHPSSLSMLNLAAHGFRQHSEAPASRGRKRQLNFARPGLKAGSVGDLLMYRDGKRPYPQALA